MIPAFLEDRCPGLRGLLLSRLNGQGRCPGEPGTIGKFQGGRADDLIGIRIREHHTDLKVFGLATGDGVHKGVCAAAQTQPVRELKRYAQRGSSEQGLYLEVYDGLSSNEQPA